MTDYEFKFSPPPIRDDNLEERIRFQIATAFSIPFHVWYGDKQTKIITMSLGNPLKWVWLWWLKKRHWKVRRVDALYPEYLIGPLARMVKIWLTR